MPPKVRQKTFGGHFSLAPVSKMPERLFVELVNLYKQFYTR